MVIQVAEMVKEINFTKLHAFNILVLRKVELLDCASKALREQGSCDVSTGYIYTRGLGYSPWF